MNCAAVTPILGGYLDGELDLLHALELEEHLAHCESCAQALRQLEAVSATTASAPRYTASHALRRRLAGPPQAHPWPRAGWAAVAATLILAAFTLWRFWPAAPDPSLLQRDLVQSHIRSLLADHLLDVRSTDWRMVQPWFRGKLDYAPVVEDISTQGFALAGGRLDYLAGRPVAAVVYERSQHVINVFVWPAPGSRDQQPSARVVDGFNVVGWRANGMNWWAVSDLSPVELEQLPLCPCFMPPKSTLHVSLAGRPARDPS
jgi:anti-sigma factor RsiW